MVTQKCPSCKENPITHQMTAQLHLVNGEDTQFSEPVCSACAAEATTAYLTGTRTTADGHRLLKLEFEPLDTTSDGVLQ